MLVFQGNLDLPQAIQKYAADVGINIELDVADPGRFFGALFGTGWGGGLLQWMVPVDPEFAIGWLVHFGKEPIIFYSSLQWPDKYWELMDKFYFAPTIAEGRQATKDMMTYASEEAQLIPTFRYDDNICRATLCSYRISQASLHDLRLVRMVDGETLVN